MIRLRQRDLATFSRVLVSLYADTSAETLSERILGSLHGLFSCDFASFSLMDLRQGSWHKYAMSGGVSDWPGVEVYQHFLREDPAARYIMRTRKPQTVKVSDFVGLRQYRALGVYREVFGRVGCDRRMGFAVHGKTPVNLAITINRKRRDFTDEERTLLDLLRPHLLQANSQTRAYKLVWEAQERERQKLGDAFGAGLGELDADGRLLWLTPRAEAILTEFFPTVGHRSTTERLPEELERLLRPTLASNKVVLTDTLPGLKRFVWQFEGPAQRLLRVRLAAAEVPGRWYLLLEERNVAPIQLLAAALRLTLREAEVLHWLTQGKTNWEVGVILGITSKTAGKHLENIFGKLHVENRAAAVRMALEASADF